MDFQALLKSLEATSVATAIRENEIIFPWIESVHVLAIVVVIGTISIIDLRLLGIASLDRPASHMTREVLPCTWAAFALAAITGSLLFSSRAVDYAHNLLFEGKMVLLALAGVNMVIFHLFAGRKIEAWGARPPLPARIAGGISLVLWISVVAFGRGVGFTLH